MGQKSLGLLGLTLVLLGSGCSTTAVNGVFSTDEKRIWVVRVKDDKHADVFRCADGAAPEQPPKPVCIRAPFVDSPE